MKVVILNAGMGTRLDESTNHLPKSLTQLSNGISILQYQLNALASHISLDDVFIVVGYRKEAIMDRFPNFTYIYNPLFAQENTSKSLLRALNKINEDVLWLNGDVIFRPSILPQMLQNNHSAMLVNRTEVGEEEVKYRSNEQGRILEISKQVSHADGEALGINFFKQQDLPLFKKQLDLCKPQDYFEKAIEECIKQGSQVWSVQIPVQDCVEIDFPEDLAKANKLLQSWK